MLDVYIFIGVRFLFMEILLIVNENCENGLNIK